MIAAPRRDLLRADRLVRALAKALKVSLRGGPAQVTPAVLNMAQFCQYIGVSPATGWRMVGLYQVPHTKPTPKSVRILKTDADAFLAARRVTCAQDARRLTDGRRT